MRNLTFALVAASLISVGCGPDPSAPLDAPQAGSTGDQPFVPQAEAGIKLNPTDPTQLIADASAQQFLIRPDPFALRAYEVAYDRSQFAARMLDTNSFYPNIAEVAEPVQEVFETEPQPARRLAGIILGESVTALIDMGDGRLRVIWPGQQIEGTEWTVFSIDEEKAVLRRDPRSKKRPQFVVVRLQPDDGATVANPAGQGGGQGQGQGAPGGAAGGRTGGGRGQEPD